MKKSFQWLSLRLSQDFLPNLVLVIGAIFVWRWVWWLIDKYFITSNETLSLIVSIAVWIFIIYLPDWSLRMLGWRIFKLEETLTKVEEQIEGINKWTKNISREINKELEDFKNWIK